MLYQIDAVNTKTGQPVRIQLVADSPENALALALENADRDGYAIQTGTNPVATASKIKSRGIILAAAAILTAGAAVAASSWRQIFLQTVPAREPEPPASQKTNAAPEAKVAAATPKIVQLPNQVPVSEPTSQPAPAPINKKSTYVRQVETLPAWMSLDAEGKINEAYRLIESSAPEDQKTAFEIFQYLAKNGKPDTYFEICRCFFLGIGVQQNYEASFQALRQGADAGSDYCLKSMAVFLIEGRGTPADPQKGAEILQFLVGKGDHDAGIIYALYLIDQKKILPRKPQKALDLLHAAAEAGNVRAMYELSAFDYYKKGEPEVSANVDAIAWLKKAAAYDGPYKIPCLRLLADIYCYRDDDAKNSYAYALQAAELGDREAMIFTARILVITKKLGIQVLPKGEQRNARYWLTAALKLGNADQRLDTAWTSLDILSKNGTVTLTEKEASPYKETIDEIAATGHSNARALQLLCIMQGFGVPQNLKTAVDELTKQAENGNAYAAYALGIVFANGYSTDMHTLHANTAIARKWFQKSGHSGEDIIAQAEQKLSERMATRIQHVVDFFSLTPEQEEAAQMQEDLEWQRYINSQRER